MEKQSFIQNICNITGMSKRSLAGFVDASPSTLSRYDAGTRGLHAKALMPLVKIYTGLSTGEDYFGPGASEEDINALQAQAAWCLAQCHPLQKKLTAMQRSCQQAMATLTLLDALAAENAGGFTTKKQRWMDEQYFVARKKCKANAPDYCPGRFV